MKDNDLLFMGYLAALFWIKEKIHLCFCLFDVFYSDRISAIMKETAAFDRYGKTTSNLGLFMGLSLFHYIHLLYDFYVTKESML